MTGSLVAGSTYTLYFNATANNNLTISEQFEILTSRDVKT